MSDQNERSIDAEGFALFLYNLPDDGDVRLMILNLVSSEEPVYWEIAHHLSVLMN